METRKINIFQSLAIIKYFNAVYDDKETNKSLMILRIEQNEKILIKNEDIRIKKIISINKAITDSVVAFWKRYAKS